MLSKNIYNIMNSKNFLYLSVFLTLFLIIAYLLNKGPNYSSPDTLLHLKWAESLVNLKFNFYDFFKQNSFVTPVYFYTVQIILVATTNFFFENNWFYFLFGLNLLLVFLSILFFLKILLMIGIRPIIISFCVPLILISPDWMSFPSWILTDTIYSFLVIFLTYVIASSLIKESFSYYLIIFILVLMFFSRPSFPPIILAVITFVLIYNYNIQIKPKLLFILFFLFFLITPIFFTLVHYLGEIYLSENSTWLYWSNLADKGIVIWKRYETYTLPPNTFFDHVFFYFLRLISFFKPYANTFSKFHIIVNFIQLSYFIFSIYLWSVLCSNNKIFNKLIIFILLLTVNVSAFHSFILIDWDWRYRYPIILPLMLILPISLEILLRKYLKK